jgi:glycosyltransferase involved in cell wall biosynthesis
MTAPRRLRVLHAVPDLLYGGLQRLVLQMTRLTDPTRFDVHVLVLGETGGLATALGADAPIHLVGRQARWSMLWPSQLARRIREIAPDVLHSHSGVWYKASRAARMANVPWLVHTDHGRMVPDPWAARLVDRLASRRTDVVVAVSQPLAQRLRRRVVAHPERVRVVINGVDTDAIRPASPTDPNLRAELDIAADAAVVGSIGRLEPIKGYDVMLASLAALPPELSQTVLVLAGDGSARPDLERRARELGLERRVRYLGWRDDLAAVLGTLDLFVLTSRSEGTSVSLLEAMSAGLCPVVTAVGGTPDVIGPDLAHRLVPSEDPRAIAAGWAAALLDPAARARDGARARQRVVQGFSLRAMVASYERIYLEGSSMFDKTL